ncbi:unnamed protein product [Rotaria socialis]|uniref:AAA+ ATPase domain-containing protein n=1 Tax=Rotaria socialis TaxID=392032 RepID=A0A817WK43_9BILA|nr:unnamed protein product [Rotaria socialis]
MATPAARMYRGGKLQRLNNDNFCKPYRCRLPCLKIVIDPKSRLRRCYVGQSQELITLSHEEKVVLLVGETGTGKTTLINSLVNYYYGVAWADEFRLILIAKEDEADESIVRSQSESQTHWITAYTLHWQPNCPVDYTLTLIDTPGYNDPQGVQTDNLTTENLGKFFNLNCIEYGIDRIDGIAFVVLNSQTRLTTTQRYVFHAVLSIFGKDIKENIFLMATHADTDKPGILEAAKAAGIPHQECLLFNNSNVCCRNEKKKSQGKNEDDDDDDEVTNGQYVWKKNMKQMINFFRMLHNIRPQSLTLTKEVLHKRQYLYQMLESRRENISSALDHLVNLDKENKFLTIHGSTSNPDTIVAEDYIKFCKYQHITLSNSERATNCKTCHRTCHYPCDRKTEDLWNCHAMDYHYYETLFVYLNISSPRNTQCNICPQKCAASSHTSETFRYKLAIEKRSLDLKSIQEYHELEGATLSPEKLSLCVEKEFNQARVKLYCQLKEANSIILRLDEIALRPQSLEIQECTFLQNMIDEEAETGSNGWANRVEHLKYLMHHHKFLQEIKKRFAS